MAGNEFATLQQGINDLFEGLQKKQTNEANYAKEQKKQAAQLNLGQEVLSSNQGSTTRGRLIGKSLQAGLLTPNEAITALENTDPFKFYLDIQAKAFESQDPQLMKAAVVAGNIYRKSLGVKFREQAYGQEAGILQAKSEYGVLNKGGKGKGGSGVQETNPSQNKVLPIPSTGLSDQLLNYFRTDPKAKKAAKAVYDQYGTDIQDPKFLTNLYHLEDDDQYFGVRDSVVDMTSNYIRSVNPRIDPSDSKFAAHRYFGILENEGIGGTQKLVNKDGTVTAAPYRIDVEMNPNKYLYATSDVGEGKLQTKRKKNQPDQTTLIPSLNQTTVIPQKPQKKSLFSTATDLVKAATNVIQPIIPNQQNQTTQTTQPPGGIADFYK